jgi:hypothetical protein
LPNQRQNFAKFWKDKNSGLVIARFTIEQQALLIARGGRKMINNRHWFNLNLINDNRGSWETHRRR